MSTGKVSAAVKHLSQSAKGNVLSLDSLVPCGVDSIGSPLFKSIQNILNDKHPLTQPAFVEPLLEPDSVKAPPFYSVLFNGLTGDLIKLAALQTQDAAGPSGVNAYS